MSNVFTLDALRNETIRRYAPTEIDLGDGATVELLSILRLREKDRKAVLAAIESINDVELDEDSDDEADLIEWSESVVEACSKVFRLITPGHKKLILKLEHDDPKIKANLFTAVLTRWIGESQLGEAESSPAS
jgi:hypothetical protein